MLVPFMREINHPQPQGIGGWLFVLCACLLVWGPVSLGLVASSALEALPVRGLPLGIMLLARVFVTALGIGKTETYNLKLVHAILDSMRSKADPRSLVEKVETDPSAPTSPTPDASTTEKVGTGCIIAETLNIMRPVQPGVKPPGEPPPTDRKCEDP